MTMNFNQLPEFKKEFKKLQKKYESLPDDLQTFCNTVSVTPIVKSKKFAVIHRTETIRIVKARLFCRYLKGSSLRIIYSWNEQFEQRIELQSNSISKVTLGKLFQQRESRTNQELPKEQPNLQVTERSRSARVLQPTSSNTPTPSVPFRVVPWFIPGGWCRGSAPVRVGPWFDNPWGVKVRGVFRGLCYP